VQLRDEVLTLLLAGHETTGDALCWTFMQLDAHAPVAARVRAEVDDVLDDRSPDAGALAALTFTTGVIDESMRLYPPAWLFTRTAVADDVIDGHAIPRKAFVLISPYVNHRLPRFWGERADDFDPDRFAASSAEGRERYAYFPFGGGPHACIGKHVSYIELQVAVAMIARRYDIRFIPGQRFEPLPRISLLPSDAMRVTLHRRAA
jgi:cytochrome P450